MWCERNYVNFTEQTCSPVVVSNPPTSSTRFWPIPLELLCKKTCKPATRKYWIDIKRINYVESDGCIQLSHLKKQVCIQLICSECISHDSPSSPSRINLQCHLLRVFYDQYTASTLTWANEEVDYDTTYYLKSYRSSSKWTPRNPPFVEPATQTEVPWVCIIIMASKRGKPHPKWIQCSRLFSRIHTVSAYETIG